MVEFTAYEIFWDEETVNEIAEKAGVTPQIVEEWLNYDWDGTPYEEHAKWLDEASIEEIASWIKAGQ